MSLATIFTCDICGATTETFCTKDKLWADIIFNWMRGKDRCLDVCPDCMPRVEKFVTRLRERHNPASPSKIGSI